MGKKRSFFWESLAPKKLWYLVGLITSDGCLSKDGRHIDITAKEQDFLHLLRSEMEFKCSVAKKMNGQGQQSFRVQISSKSFHQFLQEKGLTPNKSKTIRKIEVPEEHFGHFLRGVMDGDGCIRNWQDHAKRISQWYCKITSGSQAFLGWIDQRLREVYAIKGSIHLEHYGESSAYILKISSKYSLKKFLGLCYENAEFALSRKRAQALQCLQSL